MLSYRYFGTVNHTKGWCPGSKAATFSQNGSYVTVPNINITACGFTIAFWVKYIGVDGPLLELWSKGGELFNVTVKNSRLRILSIHDTFQLQMNYWNHVAVTCQQHKIKVFVNGTKKALVDQRNEFFFSSLGRYQSEYIIGNDPGLVQMPMANGVFVGAVMDLYVTGIGLSVKQIGDLIKGESSIYSRVSRILRLQSQTLNRGLLNVKIRILFFYSLCLTFKGSLELLKNANLIC